MTNDVIFILNFFVLLVYNIEARSLQNENSSKRPPLNNNKLIIISYDGFSNEYFKREYLTPYMNNFKNAGVSAKYMKNVFPTKTFPNHFSISTGLFPSEHGVTSSEIYDTSKKKTIGYSYEMFHYIPNIVPIWTWNELNGGTSGCCMWTGSNFEYSGVNCTYLQKYNTSVPIKQRVATVISWLLSATNPPNLVMLYIENPDKTGHSWGIESNQVNNEIRAVDSLTEYIHDQLTLHHLDDSTNVIHLSDHGMTDVSPPNFINLTNYLTNGTYQIYGTSPVLQIVPSEGKLSEVFNILENASKTNGHFNVYNMETLPARWHCNNTDRFGPIVAVADLNYAFQDMSNAAKYYEDHENVPFTNESKYGIHGYDNDLPLMWPYFMAIGPVFKRNHIVEPFNTVDLFPLFCKILNINVPSIVQGNFENVADVLKQDVLLPASAWTAINIIVMLLVAVSLIFLITKKNYGKCNKKLNTTDASDLEGEGQRLMQTSPTNSD